MTNEMIELGKRAVACKGWRWMPGMRVEWVGMSTGWRMLSETQSWYEREEVQDGEPGGPNAIPDLTDPATLGCVLALVREAWSDPQIYVAGRGLWDVFTGHDVEIVQDQYTEEEALVSALEAAP
jgi:hypothetical protein